MATKTPPGLKTAGRRLWRSITDEFDLAEHERILLLTACRYADTMDRFAAEMAIGQPLTVTNARGDEVANPRIVEMRQTGQALARVLASLRIPDPDDARPQRRGAIRQPYGIRGAI